MAAIVRQDFPGELVSALRMPRAFSPQKILFAESSPNVGGQELQILQQMRGLGDFGVEARLLAPPSSGVARLALAHGLPLSAVEFRGALDPQSVVRTLAIIRAWRPQAVVSHSSHDSYVCALAARFVRPRPILIRVKTYQGGRRPRTWALNHLFDKVLVPSAALRAELERGGDSTRSSIGILYPGIDFAALDRDRMLPLPREVERWIERRPGFLITQAAMLRPEKGHLFMLEVFKKFLAETPNARYIIAGDGPMRAEIEHRVKGLGLHDHVLVAGFISAVAPLLVRADLVVAPSFVESLGMLQAEALGLGVPVLASDVGGIPESFAGSEAGILVMAGSKEAWGRALRRVHDDHAALCAKASAGAMSVRTRFSMTANMQQLLETIMAGRAS
ncbi:glycosyltransferase family 4 protein [Acidiferrobacter sp.]|uniref:glycosyltransferase family 4 protein n=1 Tax=Acidiferrobacter sp. TaxID=1872107 RepID=UPI00262E1732|nr:glycosyltransferase family 4 protein [Acidiferrobacter sp.]